MENRKYRLNSASSQRAVNEDTFDKVHLESKSNLVPMGETNKVINVGEQFNSERQDSKYYRITGSFNALFNNTLFNTTGTNSWTTFNQDAFRVVPNGDVNDNSDDLTYREAVSKYWMENNGWFGYNDPNPANQKLCTWVDMEPRRELFSLTPKNLVKNWELTITYPTKLGGMEGDYFHPIVNGGLFLIDVFQTVIGERNMLTFATPVKHNLKQGDAVDLSGLLINDGSSTLSPYNGQYSVIRLGKDNGDEKEYYFSVDIEELIATDSNSRMSKMVNGRKSSYYVRVFTKIKTQFTNVIEDDDYEIYPLAFGQTIYEDKAQQFVFNEDIDISDLRDNLNRPLSEIYLTIVKTSDNGFTPIKSGVKMPLFTNAASNNGLSDVNRITNDVDSHIPLDENVLIDNETFYGDVVEYSVFELKETVLGDVYHRFNTFNRESGGNVDGINLGRRYEGYMYKPHHRIKIREYSNYIEQGNFSTLSKPSYATSLNDGRYIWRDLLDIGLNDTQETYLDYPFLNGSHYINTCITLPLFRQDPFGFYSLQWGSYPTEAQGAIMDDKVITKTSQDVC
jgi:hypothetical protein